MEYIEVSELLLIHSRKFLRNPPVFFQRIRTAMSRKPDRADVTVNSSVCFIVGTSPCREIHVVICLTDLDTPTRTCKYTGYVDSYPGSHMVYLAVQLSKDSGFSSGTFSVDPHGRRAK
jgi:hypothetical protein